MALKVIKKVNTRVKFLHRKKMFLSQDTMKLLANCIILSQYDYACTYWFSGVSAKSKHMLQTSQNKTLRLVLDLPPRAHLEPSHFKTVGWLPVKQRVSFLKLGHMYRMINGTAPRYLRTSMVLRSQIHGRHLRSGPLAVSEPKKGSKGFLYTASRLWNSLPRSIQNSPSLDSFKRAVKRQLQ